MIKKLTLAIVLATATMVASPATAQTEDAGEAPKEAVAATAEPEPTTPDLKPSEPAKAPDSEAEPKESDADHSAGTISEEAEAAEELARAGKWVAALGALMLLIVGVFRKFIFARVDWFQTKQGGYAAAAGIATATIIGLGIKTGFSVEMVLAVLSASSMASGLHTAVSDFKSRGES